MKTLFIHYYYNNINNIEKKLISHTANSASITIHCRGRRTSIFIVYNCMSEISLYFGTLSNNIIICIPIICKLFFHLLKSKSKNIFVAFVEYIIIF